MDERPVSARAQYVDFTECSVEVYEAVVDGWERHEVSFRRRVYGNREYEVYAVDPTPPEWMLDNYTVVDTARRAWDRLDAGLPC